MTECGKAIGWGLNSGEQGGIWLPHAGGGVDFKEVFCNVEILKGERPGSHPGPCMYVDPLSGNAVVPRTFPTRKVDGRGCIQDASG